MFLSVVNTEPHNFSTLRGVLFDVLYSDVHVHPAIWNALQRHFSSTMYDGQCST